MKVSFFELRKRFVQSVSVPEYIFGVANLVANRLRNDSEQYRGGKIGKTTGLFLLKIPYRFYTGRQSDKAMAHYEPHLAGGVLKSGEKWPTLCFVGM